MDEYFEGDYRRLPEQNLAGACSRVVVSDLLTKSHSERKKREESRAVIEKVIVIQAAYRGYATRSQLRAQLLEEFEYKISIIVGKHVEATLGDIVYLLQRLNYFFLVTKKWCEKGLGIPNCKMDIDKFVLMMKLTHCHKNQIISAMNTDRIWINRICSLLKLNMIMIENLPFGIERNFISFFRTLKYFTDIGTYKRCYGEAVGMNTLGIVWKSLLMTDVLNYLIKAVDFKERLPRRIYTELLGSMSQFFRIFVGYINICESTEHKQFLLKFLAKTLIPCNLPPDFIKHVLPNIKEEGLDVYELSNVYIKFEQEDKNAMSLYRFLFFDQDQEDTPPQYRSAYFVLLSELMWHLTFISSWDEDSSEDDSASDSSSIDESQPKILESCMNMLNTKSRADVWLQYLETIESSIGEPLMVFCKCLYYLWLPEKMYLYSYRILKAVAFRPIFLRSLWGYIVTLQRQVTNVQTKYKTVVRMLMVGNEITSYDASKIIPTLTMFCVLLQHQITMTKDENFYCNATQEVVNFPFCLSDMIHIARTLRDVAVGIIMALYPSLTPDSDQITLIPTKDSKFNLASWKCLLEQIVALVTTIHIRDSRNRFTESNFWLTQNVQELPKPPNEMKSLEIVIPFEDNDAADGSNAYESRFLATLHCLPFAIAFFKRVKLYEHLINEIKNEFQSPVLQFLTDSSYVQIRRAYIYEDAFDNLDVDEDIRKKIKVRLISSLGVDEPGIDGGGLFREFMMEFLKTAFDPTRGFFLMNKNNELYPNPHIDTICGDFINHYNFIGKMLGKALFENILVEIPLAEFFMASILGLSTDIYSYVNGLSSLDPDLYKNLTSLLVYTGNFSDLELYFSISEDCFGRQNVVPLMPEGNTTRVDKENVLEYIHEVAHYKIYTQMSVQTEAFVKGLYSVIPQHWLAMFSTSELQLIISGNENAIDVNDWRTYTIYSGDYTRTHPTIELFWRIVSGFDDTKKSQLLKFVTSCSRPPLLGFRMLYPRFCIQFVEGTSFLPTTSTCMNMLKLPNIQDEEGLRSKLLYAISSGSGFELL